MKVVILHLILLQGFIVKGQFATNATEVKKIMSFDEIDKQCHSVIKGIGQSENLDQDIKLTEKFKESSSCSKLTPTKNNQKHIEQVSSHLIKPIEKNVAKTDSTKVEKNLINQRDEFLVGSTKLRNHYKEQLPKMLKELENIRIEEEKANSFNSKRMKKYSELVGGLGLGYNRMVDRVRQSCIKLANEAKNNNFSEQQKKDSFEILSAAWQTDESISFILSEAAILNKAHIQNGVYKSPLPHYSTCLGTNPSGGMPGSQGRNAQHQDKIENWPSDSNQYQSSITMKSLNSNLEKIKTGQVNLKNRYKELNELSKKNNLTDDDIQEIEEKVSDVFDAYPGQASLLLEKSSSTLFAQFCVANSHGKAKKEFESRKKGLIITALVIAATGGAALAGGGLLISTVGLAVDTALAAQGGKGIYDNILKYQENIGSKYLNLITESDYSVKQSGIKTSIVLDSILLGFAGKGISENISKSMNGLALKSGIKDLQKTGWNLIDVKNVSNLDGKNTKLVTEYVASTIHKIDAEKKIVAEFSKLSSTKAGQNKAYFDDVASYIFGKTYNKQNGSNLVTGINTNNLNTFNQIPQFKQLSSVDQKAFVELSNQIKSANSSYGNFVHNLSKEEVKVIDQVARNDISFRRVLKDTTKDQIQGIAKDEIKNQAIETISDQAASNKGTTILKNGVSAAKTVFGGGSGGGQGASGSYNTKPRLKGK